MTVTPEPIELADLVAGLAFVDPDWDRKISSVVCDHRDVTKNCLFIAYPGFRADPRQFIPQAIAAGASAVLAENTETHNDEVVLLGQTPIFYAENVQQKVGLLAARLYQHPSRKLRMIGVTGTNGKTSFCHLLTQALQVCDDAVAMIGTLGIGPLDRLQENAYTTPQPVQLVQHLAEFVEMGIHTVAMEVSSHALAQGRVRHIEFDVAAFTNLTRDHLDYHKTMEAYAQTKLSLFQKFGLKKAVLNVNDPFSTTILDTLQNHVKVFRYGIRNPTADVCCQEIHYDTKGFRLNIMTPAGELQCQTQLMGAFNVSNLLGVIATLIALDYPLTTIEKVVPQLTMVPGRMQIYARAARPAVIVDYAHTPDALEQALHAVRDHYPNKKIWCVFGCGGDRDAGKRPTMGAIAERYADKVIITADNPRTETIDKISQDILHGMKNPRAAHLVQDRGEAIAYAIENAHPEDAILVAGKGHETFQILGAERKSFSDVKTVESLLAS